MGPNEGRTLLGRTICIARALMADRPSEVSRVVVAAQKEAEYAARQGNLDGKWVLTRFSHGDWYVLHEPATALLQGGSKSQRAPPPGAKIAAVIDVRSGESGVIDRFTVDVGQLERDSVAEAEASVHQLLLEKQGVRPGDMTSNPPATGAPNPLVWQIADLRWAVSACQHEFDGERIEAFRKLLRQHPECFERASSGSPLLVNPDPLVSFTKELVDAHTKRCVDARLAGCIATICDICMVCAEQSKAMFGLLSQPLIGSSSTKPEQLLTDTVHVAVSHGFVDALLRIVERYREIVGGKVEAAHNAESVDASLDALYGAMPYQIGVFFVLNALCHFKESLNAETASLVAHMYDGEEERMVRMRGAFTSQVEDLDGRVWEGHRRSIAAVRETEGGDAARELADVFVNRLLLYPRSIIPALMGEATPNAISGRPRGRIRPASRRKVHRSASSHDPETAGRESRPTKSS